MKAWNDFSISEGYRAKYSGVGFGITLISGCKPVTDQQAYDQYKRKLLRKMRKRETLAEITERINTYDNFFQSFGFECPLPKHLKRTVNSGFPQYNLMVDAHFMAEMCAGILVAVTDYDRFNGKLLLDVAKAGEISEGMGQRDFVDEKTRVKEETTNVFFYAYAVPGIDSVHLKGGLTVAAETMADFGAGRIEGIEIY
jgi:DNA/RNA-binding domain of Phe-tRNA-synthetase-like protein